MGCWIRRDRSVVKMLVELNPLLWYSRPRKCCCVRRDLVQAKVLQIVVAQSNRPLLNPRDLDILLLKSKWAEHLPFCNRYFALGVGKTRLNTGNLSNGGGAQTTHQK